METPVFLPAEHHGQRGLVVLNPWGGKESDMTERLTLSLSIYSHIDYTYIHTYYTCVYIHIYFYMFIYIHVYIYMDIHHFFLIQSSADGHSCCFYILAAVNNGSNIFPN